MALSLTRIAVVTSLVTSVLVALPAAAASSVASATSAGTAAEAPTDPQIVDASSAADQPTASEIATTFGHAVTVDSATTETELVQAQPDGTMQLTEDSAPVRVQRNGEWQPTDPTLSSVGGVLQPAAAAVPVQFSTGGSGAMAKVQTPSGQWLTETWPSGSLPAPVVAGDTATYPEVYPGVDLKLSATDIGMAQVLVIKDAQAAADPELKNVAIGVENGNLTTLPSGGGAVTKGPDGSTQLTAPVATWWDSTEAGSSADGPGGNAVSLPITGTVTDSQISLNAAAPALKPDVTFPVYVDPDWNSTTNLGWATVDATFPNQPYWEGTAADAQHVGYIDAAETPAGDGRDHTARSYWRMDVSQVTGSQINSAAFHASMVHSYNCNPTPVQLWTTGLASSSTTWNNPGPRGLPLINLSDTESYPMAGACGNTDTSWDASDAVKRAVAAGDAGLNLGLVASSETSPTGWKKFAPQAHLIINYGETPTVPYNRHVAPCFSVCGGSYGLTRSPNPTFYARSDDHDQGVHLTYYFRSCPGTPSTADASNPACITFHTLSVAPNADTAYAVPSNMSVPEGQQSYQVKACSSLAPTTLCSALSNWYPYTVDRHAPDAPTATSTEVDLTNAQAKGNEGSTATFTIHPPGSANVADYVYSAGVDSQPSLTSPTCPRSSGSYRIVCTDVTTGSFTLSAASSTGTLTLWSVDTAGNVSTAQKYSYRSVAPPPLYGEGHNWILTPDMSDATGTSLTVPDGNQNTAVKIDLTVSGTVHWDVNGRDITDPSQEPNAQLDASMPNEHEAALHFEAGASPTASTPSNANTPPVTIDSGHGFAIFAWVKPVALSSPATERVIASQNSASTSFVLKETTTGAWAFCLPTGSGGPANHCSVTPIQAVPGRWTMVEGLWDARAGKLLVRVRNYDCYGGKDSGAVDPDCANVPATANGVADGSPVGHTAVAPSDPSAGILIGSPYATSSTTTAWAGDLTDPYIFTAATNDPDYDNTFLSETDQLWGGLPGNLGQ